MNDDTRNVIDEFKGLTVERIKEVLDETGSMTEVAIENTLRDFNMGTIVRSANAFGVRTVHVVGRRQWNKRGAMMTDKYMNIVYHQTFMELKRYALGSGRMVVAVDNIPTAIPITKVSKSENAILLFGQEGPGLSSEALECADIAVAIEQRGSTRSLNVGVAAGIALHEWTYHLTD